MKLSKSQTLLGTAGVVVGLLSTYSKGDIKKTLFTASVLGLCGVLAGYGISKIYE